MSFALRPYQVEALDAVLAAAGRGVHRMLIVLATGAGKTVVFSHVRQHLGLNGRMLVIAHRAELLDQAAEKIARVNPDLRVEVEQAERAAGASADVVVASVATIGRKGCKRLVRLRPDEFDLIVIDEAHHAVAKSYLNILEHFGVLTVDVKQDGKPAVQGTGSGPLLLGVTATPERGDDVGLSAVFEEVVYERHLRDMIQDGWLSRIKAYRAPTDVDLSGIATKMGDYVVSELAQKINTPQRNALAVRCYQAMAYGRRALAFCADIQHARALAEMFRADWIPAATITGDTPSDERREIIAQFRAGEIVVLTNVMVLTEGFDCPEIGTLLMCRPTKSVGLYLQMLGRGTRLADGKDDLLVIDFADTTSHRLPTAATILGLPPKWDCKGKDVMKEHEQLLLIAQEAGSAQDILSQSVSIEDARRMLTEIPILAEAEQIRNELRGISEYRWMRLPSGAYYIPLPDTTVITVREDQLGHWSTRIANATGFNADLAQSPYLEAPPGPMTTRDEAIRFADSYIEMCFPDAARVVSANARWNEHAPTEKQEALLRRMKRWRDGLTRGQASQIIDAVFSKRKEA